MSKTAAHVSRFWCLPQMVLQLPVDKHGPASLLLVVASGGGWRCLKACLSQQVSECRRFCSAASTALLLIGAAGTAAAPPNCQHFDGEPGEV